MAAPVAYTPSAEDAQYLAMEDQNFFLGLLEEKQAGKLSSPEKVNAFRSYLEEIAQNKAQALSEINNLIKRGDQLEALAQKSEDLSARSAAFMNRKEQSSCSWLKVLTGVVGAVALLAGAALLAVSLIFGWGIPLIAVSAFLLVTGLGSSGYCAVTTCSS